MKPGCGLMMPLPPLLLLAAAALVSLSAATAQERCSHVTGAVTDDRCRAPGSNVVCSRRGSCVCGFCECDRSTEPNRTVYGEFCECTDFTCDAYEGRLCGGEDRGRCECGLCKCRPGWQGSACQCPLSTADCIEPGSDRICSNKGSCQCGSCRCAEFAGEKYSGKFCETCPTCRGKCDTYRHCVECLAFDTGPLKARCQEDCGQVRMDLEDEPTVSDYASDRACSFFTPEGCRFLFIYGSGGSLRVRRRLECPAGNSGLPTPPSASQPANSGSAPTNSVVVWAAELLTALWWW